ncbi:MAG: peptidoglycan DD-metalloendopeptidase family protein [Eubacterium callanderi]|uniref:peptidoglycan DD-metalloendopeptidase family protein n=1 Tax=Eubacterium callanderi TaxID=53442 RepID=UPI0026729674|nr:peptidoglycan DD-metalloendopeptidase family protein [Eubacterium callanderi]
MAKSDGQVIIEARIDTDKAEKDLKNLENKVQKTAKNIEKTNVKVKVDSDTDKATKDLKGLESKAKDLSKNKAKVSVTADVEEADADLVRLKAQAKTLDKMKVEAAVKAETASAAANLARMQAQMRTINQMKAKATVTADSSQAEGKTSKLKSLIKTLVDKVHKVVIDADTTGAMASLAALNEKTKKATSGIKSMLVSLGVVNAISGAFNTLKSSISGAVSRFDTMKKYPKVMESLGVSSEMSSKSIQRLSEGIEGLPTTLDMVVSTAQRMTSMTGNIDKSTEATIALNNAFLASGSSTEDASRGMEQYLQMLSRGEVDLEGWRSLQETMPVALQKVAEAFGMTGEAAQRDLYDKLKSGEITFKDFQDKLIELGTGTGMLADLAKTNSEGVATSFKNLKTAVVKNWEMILAKIEEVSQKMTGKSIAENINGLKPLINDFFNGVASAIDKVVPYFQWFIDHGDAVIGVIGAIASAFAVLKVAGAIGSVFEAFHKAEKVLEKAGKSVTFLSKAFEVIGMGPIPIIIAAVAALAGALIVAYNTSETFRNAVNNLFSKIAESVGPIIEQAIGAFSGLSEVISNTLGIALANLAPVLARFADFFSQMVVAIAPLIAQLVGSLAPVIATIVTVLMNIVQSIMPALTAVLNVIMAVLEAVGPVVMNILSIVIDVISAAMQYISLIISFIGACINTIVAIISPIVAVIGGIMALIIDAIGKALSFITGVIATVVDLIVGTWTKVTNYIIDAINKVSGVISTISSVVGTVFNGIYTVCTSVMDKVDAVIRGVFDNIRSSWEGLTGFVDNIFHGVEGAVNDLVSQVKGFVNGVIGGINAAVGLINKIPGVTISEIPYLARGTDNFKGGFARINEGGRGELVMLPDGTQVIPHDVSMKYASEAAKASVGVDNQRVNPSVYLDVEKPKKEDNSFVKGIAEDIDAEWQKVSDSTTTKWQAIKTFLETTWASIKQNTINTAALMTHEIQGRFTTNYSTINNLTTSFASMMGQQWQRVLSQITAVLDRISSASSSKFNEVKNTAISIMNGLPSALYNVGVSAMNDLISGINSRQGDANNAASSLVESLLNKFKEGLGIASPSREMFSIGQYMLQGLINGLDGDNLLKFVDNIVGTIKDNFSTINLKQLINAMGSDVTKLWQKLGINFGSGAFGEGGMMWPTDSQSITSYFGGRDSPGGIGSTNHMGIDIGASEGTPIYAALPGTVTTAGWYGGYGNAVIIDHGGGMQTLYGHMSAVGTSPGMNVMPGQVIGFVGSTGNSTGPHLHFSVIQDGQWLDPLAFFPGFKVGSKYIPNDMLAYLHEGEAVVRKDENPHANSKGSFWTDILKGAVNSQNASIQNETSQFFYNTTNMITNNNNNETIQNVYFQETPKRPSEFRQALKQEGRRLAFGKQGL